jgi:hypothetical protein
LKKQIIIFAAGIVVIYLVTVAIIGWFNQGPQKSSPVSNKNVTVIEQTQNSVPANRQRIIYKDKKKDADSQAVVQEPPVMGPLVN